MRTFSNTLLFALSEPAHQREHLDDARPLCLAVGEFVVEAGNVDHDSLRVTPRRVIAERDVLRRFEHRHPGIVALASLAMDVLEVALQRRDAFLVRDWSVTR